MELPIEYKLKVKEEIFRRRDLYQGSQAGFAKSIGLNASVFSRLKNGEIDSIISDDLWLTIGKSFDVIINKPSWVIVRTKVYQDIEEAVTNCRKHAQSKLLVDDCGIGKTQTLKIIAANTPNVFYIDCSQTKTKILFIKNLAKVLGIKSVGKVSEILDKCKYYLNLLSDVAILLDEYGDLDYNSIMLTKELWNATEGNVGWFIAGADGLKNKLRRGMENEKVGYAELFSRFSGNFIKIVPTEKRDSEAFWRDMFSEVAWGNIQISDESIKDRKIAETVKKCMAMSSGYRHDIRFLKEIIIENGLNHGN